MHILHSLAQPNTLKIRDTQFSVLCQRDINLCQYWLLQITFCNEVNCDEIFFFSLFFVLIKYEHFWTLNELNCLSCVVFLTELSFLRLLFYPFIIQCLHIHLFFLSLSSKTNMEMLSWEETMVSCIDSFSLFKINISIIKKNCKLVSGIWWKTTTMIFNPLLPKRDL